MLTKTMKAARLLTRPAWARAAAHGVAATIEHRGLARLITPRTVLDVGANKGQFAVFALGLWPGCRVVAFEPLPGPFAKARAATSAYAERVRLEQVAVGSAEGTAEIRITSRDDSSSILPLSDTARRAFGVADTGRVERVPVRTLDALVGGADLRAPVLLKIDVQGYEMEVLRGATATLRRLAAVYVEQSYVPLYEGQPLAAEVAGLLAEAGFRQAAELNVVERPDLGKLQSDCLFVPA